MEDAIKIDNLWYIPATSSRCDDRIRVLKSNDGFAVFSRHGEMSGAGLGEQGFYFLGTRHLSYWHVHVAGREPMLLNSSLRLDNSRLVVDQTTPDLFQDDNLWLPKGCMHLRRELAVLNGTLNERLELVNYHDRAHRFTVSYRFEGDFRDIFEVRGMERARRGQMEEPRLEERTVILGYQGLDGVARHTLIGFDRTPEVISAEQAEFAVDLPVGGRFVLESTVSCANGETYFCQPSHVETVSAIEQDLAEGKSSRSSVWSDNEQFNDWLNRSAADLQILTTETRYGPYTYAGIPWFSTPFGRDGLITALQTLWAQPNLALGVLRFLAATQADHTDPKNEAEPGKILHELREGEMAALGEVPFRCYYGTVDATPLFVVLAGRYYKRTGDIQSIQQLWPHIESALAWLTGKLTIENFLTYNRQGDRGLVQQGWKDSNDSVFHSDGRYATPPIALCEVQGYVWEALIRGAELAERLGFDHHNENWRQRAGRLRQDFETAFWLEDLATYALALDGAGKPCAVRSSNPGHLLYSGIVAPERAAVLARQLVSTDAFNGWGLRTIFSGEVRYNPMSYHNGSIWPHDTTLAAAGLARYGFMDEALTLIDGLFNASVFFDQHRLPELFCGFDRIPGQAPTLYPVACAPQAWASGAVFMAIEAMLGLCFEAECSKFCLRYPRLPDYIGWLRIQDLRYGDASVDLVVRRHDQEVAVNIERRQGEMELMVVI